MRKRKSVRIIAIALLCTLMIGAVIGIGVAANSSTGSNVASIGMKNLEYGEEMKLAIQVTKVMAEGDLYLGVWPEGTTDFASVEPIYTTGDILQETLSDGETVINYALTQGINAKDIGKKFVFCAYVVNGDETSYGDYITYSVTTYLQERLVAIEGLTDDESNERRTLYEAVIAYGEAAGALLNKAE